MRVHIGWAFASSALCALLVWYVQERVHKQALHLKGKECKKMMRDTKKQLADSQLAAKHLAAKQRRTMGALPNALCKYPPGGNETAWIGGIKSKIPAQACARVGRGRVHRFDLCGLSQLPPTLPDHLIEKANPRMLGDRMRALQLTVPQGGSIVEIGTLNGYLRNWMLKTLRPSHLVAMDIAPMAIDKCKQQHASAIAAGTVQCFLGDSKEQLLKLPDDSVDLMYVDGDHDYAGVCGDLEAARTKVKPGGLMVLNDYYLMETLFMGWDNPADRRSGRWGVYGVIHAANEFILRYKWELVYITLHPRNEPDLAIRRPKA